MPVLPISVTKGDNYNDQLAVSEHGAATGKLERNPFRIGGSISGHSGIMAAVLGSVSDFT